MSGFKSAGIFSVGERRPHVHVIHMDQMIILECMRHYLGSKQGAFQYIYFLQTTRQEPMVDRKPCELVWKGDGMKEKMSGVAQPAPCGNSRGRRS